MVARERRIDVHRDIISRVYETPAFLLRVYKVQIQSEVP